MNTAWNDNPKGLVGVLVIFSILMLSGLGAAAPSETVMTVDIPTHANHGDIFMITATITDTNGDPLQDVSIEFYRTTTFGKLKIGDDLTDSNGEASISHVVTYSPYNGTNEIEAVFEGTQDFEADTITGYMLIGFQGDLEEEISPDYGYNGILNLVILMVIGAWVAFGFVFVLLIGISKEGKKVQLSANDGKENG